jgi:PLP dependent protein
VSVASNLAAVEARMWAACAKAGRARSEITLIAVSKTQPDALVREAYEAGLRIFGENYVQPLVERAALVQALPGATLRMIGHLQRNKAKDVVAAGVAVDSVDSERLATAIDGHARALGRVVPVLLQVNVGGEDQKSGCTPADVPALVAAIRAMPGLSLGGLMTVPPHTDDPEGARPYFRALRSLAAAHGLGTLSMGMSHDLEIAIQEGATEIRIGTAIFGLRS